ncbi:MAG TPA: septum formation initiator family protein [Vicinamibacterales bacterium]|nr:septum formation initiator family protein [Vicinamibacterales bacterium]
MIATSTSAPASAPKTGASPRRRRVISYGLAVLTVVVLIDAVAGEKGLLTLVRTRHELQTLEQSVQAARLDNQRMLELARRYREDPVTIEELARRDLGLIKPGEKLFIIRDLPPVSPAPAPAR